MSVFPPWARVGTSVLISALPLLDLQAGLSVMLVFVGVKFLISVVVGKVPIWVSLPFVATVVTVSILASLWKTRGRGQGAVPGSQG